MAAFRTKPAEFRKFQSYYIQSLLSDHMDRYFDIFSDFFRDFGEFTQTLLLCQYNLPLSESDTSSSAAFPRTKMFYGNAFEALTSNFVVLACLDNIGKARPFDQFEQMDLQKYMTINKANRGNPFMGTSAFAIFAEGLDSTLRNASHHGAIKLNPDRLKINYRSGGTGALHQIRYIEYLYICNDIMLKLAALLMLELVISYKANAIQT